jgi:hypothetical protein
MFVKFVSIKAPEPIQTTLSDIVMLVKFVQRVKAPVLILFTLLGIITLVKTVQRTKFPTSTTGFPLCVEGITA